MLAGHKTSVSLEAAFWDGLKEIAKTKRKSLSDLVDGIDTARDHANLSSAIRLFVLNYYQTRDEPKPLLNSHVTDATEQRNGRTLLQTD
jgi:predicted DNA-binding ribbon-helix-helix protein